MERFEAWMCKLWNLNSDVDCVNYVLDSLEKQYEYEGKEEIRRCVRLFQIVCMNFKNRINEIVREMDEYLNSSMVNEMVK